jgi:uncharacterized protein related to proFAR isomerase
VIKNCVEFLKPTPVLVGAGVHSEEDIRIATSLGAVGVLLATDVVKSNDPKAELLKLAGGFSV